MLRHLYDTPTYKTNVLQLVSYEGQVKRLLQLYLSRDNLVLYSEIVYSKI